VFYATIFLTLLIVLIFIAIRDLRQREDSFLRWAWRWFLELIGIF